MTDHPEEAQLLSPHPTLPSPSAYPTARPGRDLALLLILISLLDVSGLLHVYGLSSLYGEEFFFGLGALFVLLALGLVLWPTQPVSWLRSRRPHGIPTLLAWVSLGTALAVVALWQVLAAVERATSAADLPVTTPLSEQQKLALIGLGLVALVAISTAYTRRESTRRRWLMLAGAAWLAMAIRSMALRVEATPGGSQWIERVWGLCACGLAVIAAAALIWLVRPLSPGKFLVVALVVGGTLRLLAFGQLPVNLSLAMGDMLPLIDVSTTRFLQGASPYHLYQMPYDLPLTYWPLNLLPYVPFRAWDVDLRFANLLCWLIVGAILLWLRHSANEHEPGWACYAFGVLFLTPTMVTWDLVTAAPPFWLWLCLLMAVVAWNYVPNEDTWPEEEPPPLEKARAVLPGAALGAAFAAGPLTLPFAPFLVVWWIRRGWRYALGQLGTALVVGAAIVLPFALWDRDAFWLGAVSWFNDLGNLPRAKWDFDQSWLHEVGIAGQMWKAGLQEWLKPVQLVLLASLTLLSWGRLGSPADVLRWGSAAYILFMAFNPVIWPYLYTPALLGLVFTLAARGRDVAVSATAISQLLSRQHVETPSVEAPDDREPADDFGSPLPGGEAVVP